MSLKLLWLQLTGQLKKTEKVEAKRYALVKKHEAFLEAENSEELKKYRELDAWIKTGIVERKKQELKQLVFKGSQEYHQLREFEKLKKNKSIVNYFKLVDSTELKRFDQIHGSAKLKSFRELEAYMKNGQYQKEKAGILAQKLAGSHEQKLLKEFEKLKKTKAIKAWFKISGSPELKKHEQFKDHTSLKRYLELKELPARNKATVKEFKKLRKDPAIKGYFRFENSRDLKFFRETSGSPFLNRYNELVRETESAVFREKVAYLKDKNKFLKSEPWKKNQQFKELTADPDISFYLGFERSALYKNFLNIRDSQILHRFTELKTLVTSEDYLKRKAWLEDPHKWEKSPEFANYQSFLALKKNDKIKTYFKFLNYSGFDFFKTWDVSFSDQFDGKEPDGTKWVANSLWAERFLGKPYSQYGDLQAYTGGHNTRTIQNKLVISVKKEKADSSYWSPHAGFIPASFGYTSDTLSTAGRFSQKEGIFEAKIRFAPVKQVVSSFYLSGEDINRQVTLLEMGPRNRMGILSRHGSKRLVFKGHGIGTLKRNEYFIFSLHWGGDHLKWKINETTIFESHDSSFNQPVYLNLTSLVINEMNDSDLPVNFEIAWIKCYRKK